MSVAESGSSERRISNPVLAGFYPDPSAVRVGDDYFLVTSTFEYFPGVPLFHSRDLVHWQQLGHCLTRDSQLSLQGAGSSKGIFAPTLRYHAGTFYMVTTNMSLGASFFITARDPHGPWSEPVWIEEESWGMDPSLLFDDDGKVYYTRHGGGERGGVYQAEIDPASGELDAEPRLIWAGTGGVWPEGPHLYKVGSYYYLLISEGGTSYEHRLTIARSSSPWGPFEPCASNPILTHADRRDLPIQATGHGDLLQAANGSWWLVLLGIRPTDGGHHHLGRETFLAPLTWSVDGWPVVNGGAPIQLDQPAPGLFEWIPGEAPPARDEFEGSELGLQYNYLRNPRRERYSLRARPGFLRLLGSRSTLDDEASPTFVGRRQQHLHATMGTSLEFTPADESERAGLVLRANEANHYDLSIQGVGKRRQLRMTTRVAGNASLLANVDLAAGPVALWIEAEPHQYAFFYAQGTSERRLLGQAPTLPLSSEAAGGFTGVYVGMYATAENAVQPAPADFDWFEYAPG